MSEPDSGTRLDEVLGVLETRAHRDLDLAVDAEDEVVALEVPAGRGYREETDWCPVRVVDEAGHGVQAGLDGAVFRSPPGRVQRRLAGRRPRPVPVGGAAAALPAGLRPPRRGPPRPGAVGVGASVDSVDERVPLTGALLIGLLCVVSGLAVAVVGRRAADGRLGRNALAGIRIRSTLRSDAAWLAGHAAARPASDAAGAVFAVTGLAATVTRSAPWFAGVVLAGTLGAVALLLVGVRQAVVAADRADDA
jgi:hypothetical protein